ncbi:multiprotein-bridging factor 1 family protein [Streptomyces sp. NPDC102274]|uniref:helix-turn-helix domain-containing protein n=1 Tax=Streptomyces sp. NPDC102274 TaxID=3366151 RepID=UPI00382E733F
MARSRDHQPPADFVAHGQWPLVTLVPDAPLTARFGAAFALNLYTAMTGQGLSDRALAKRAGFSHTTVGRIARGEVLPDLGTIARLEVALQADLYPFGLRATFDPSAAAGAPDEPVPPSA